MEPTIFVLGFRPKDTVSIMRSLENTVKNYNLGARVEGWPTKYATKKYLDKHATPIPGTSFVVDTCHYYMFDDDVNKPWPQYRSEEIQLFVCSTVIKEASGEDAPHALHDGEQFAKALLPETPKLILHFQNEYRGDRDTPDIRCLEIDFSQGIYHLARDIRTPESKESSETDMGAIVKELFEQDMKMPLEVYKEIVWGKPVSS